MNTKSISEPDYVGRFLLSLYHKRIFANNGKVEKSVVRKEFQNYVKENPFPAIENQKLESMLLKHTFISKASETTKTFFRIRMDNLRQYSRDLLNRLDEAQKREMFRRVTVEYPSGTTKKAELEVDPTFKEEELTFEARYLDFIDKHFILTSKGCCICQENFNLESEYIDHIEYHTQATDFESLRSKSRSPGPFFRVSYQACKDSHLLRFCIESLENDLEILKVVIIRETSMLHPQESNTPYTLCYGNRSYFFIDCHTFTIGYEQPIVIIFKAGFCRDASHMYVEQHHFLRMEPFNVDMSSALNLYMPKRGELNSRGTPDDYSPPNDLNENNMATIYRNCPKFREYEVANKVIHQENIADIFKLLLQLEDLATLNLYKKLRQRETTVSTTSGGDFTISLRLNDDIKVEDILKEGDQVELFVVGNDNVIRPNLNNKGSGNPKIFGMVEKVLKKRVIFSIRRAKAVKLEKKYDVKFSPFRYHLRLQYRALELLKNHYNVKRVLFPMQKLYTDRTVKISIAPFNENLARNPEQLEAVERIVHHMSAEAPYIIFGPPGTGKTTTIVEAIYQLWKDNPKNKILVVGGSNACVDEIAIRLQKVLEEVDPLGRNMLRIYSSAQQKKSEQIDEKLIKVSNLCHGCQIYPSLEILYMYRIVFATLSIAAKYVYSGLAETNFSHVFVDECGASTEPEVISTLIGTVTSATKVVLAGDPKQLSPVLQSKTAEQLGLGVSLLARLLNLNCYQTEPGSKIHDRSRQIRLTKNFRTHPSILHMSNQLYYDNDLEACGGTSVTSWAINWYNLPSPNFPIIFHSIKGKSKRLKGSQSLYNYSEIWVVMRYIKEMMYFGINGRQLEQSDIGIVTPYKSQVNFIRKELDERKWFEIEVGSVEKFQGQERPVIVFSTVRSQTESLGFLDSPKRLNVSLTRAQALLIIVGNPETLSASTDFNYVINYCKDNNAFKGESYIDVTSVSITDTLGDDFNNLSISKTNTKMQGKPQIQITKQSKTINNNSPKQEFKHKSQKKVAIPTVQDDTKLDNWIIEWFAHQNETLDRISKNQAGEHAQTTNINSIRPTNIGIANSEKTKTNPLLNTVTARQNPASSDTKTIPKTNVSNIPSNTSTFNSISPTRTYAFSSGETTRQRGVSSQSVQQKPSEAPVYSWQSSYPASSTLRPDQRNNFSSHPIYPTKYNVSGSTTKIKKDKTCVIL